MRTRIFCSRNSPHYAVSEIGETGILSQYRRQDNEPSSFFVLSEHRYDFVIGRAYLPYYGRCTGAPAILELFAS